jgi:multiple sugar transport system permease protein/raffinose/stachyose/melibiose transport system permease protein
VHSLLGDRRAIAVLLGPALLVYTLVMLVPIVWSMGYTLFTGGVLGGFTFDGLGNFAKLWDDARVWDALRFTLVYAAVVTVLQVLLGYLLALLYVFVLRKSSSLVRTLVFFPVILPTVAVALLFQKLFTVAPTDGLANVALESVGIGSIDFLSTTGGSFLVIVLMDLWRSMGFYGVLLFAGLLDIPDDVLESARLDGATSWRLVKHIVLPLSLPVLVSSLVFSINGTLKVFDTILALTNGGPGSSTTPLTLYMFRTAFSYGDYGYGATIALLLTVVCLAVTLVVFRVSRRVSNAS